MPVRLPVYGPVASAPALVALLRTLSLAAAQAALQGARLDAQLLTPMYRLAATTPAAEATAAARVVGEVAARLQRLRLAYGAWEQFEPEPYFDLMPTHAAQLVHVVERVSTVHVTFFVDAMLPSFQAVVTCLVTPPPAWYLGRILAAASTCRTMASFVHCVDQARLLLADNITYFATNGAAEERQRWEPWRQLPPQTGLAARLALGCHRPPP